jgi:membrane fusion protein (multidrug efflux system)
MRRLIAVPATLLLLAAAPPSPPPPAVVVQPVAVQNVSPAETFIGQVQAIQSVAIIARVQAYIDKVAFQEGGTVQPGELLFELQKAPYEAAVLQAQGQLSQAQAAQRNAEANLSRDSRAGELAISRQQIQQDEAARDEATGQVQAAQGALQTAALNLSYCDVSAPIAGRIGRAQFTLGNLVGPTSGTLATIVETDPIRVFFSVPDSELASMQVEQQGTAVDRTREQLIKSMTLDLKLPDGTRYPLTGKIEFINNQVDTATGAITFWGRFDNPDNVLIPGSYVNVDVRRAKPQNAPVVAVEAVQNDAQGQFVLIVDRDDKVRQQRVTLGKQIGQVYIVEKGLTGGEQVIVQGVQKVHAGQQVKPSEQPAPQANTSAPSDEG